MGSTDVDPQLRCTRALRGPAKLLVETVTIRPRPVSHDSLADRVAASCHNYAVSAVSTERRPKILHIAILIFGIIGMIAAFALAWEKVLTLQDKNHVPSCNFSVLVGCSTNLSSWQGSIILGIPNALWGLLAWPVVVTIGVALLSGVMFPRWMWIGLNVGTTGAFAFVCWLIYQSIFNLNVLCPWCMVTWSVTIPLFWCVTLYNLSTGNIPASPRLRKRAGMLREWLVLITVVCYAVVVLLAQIHLNAIPRLFGWA